MTTTTVANPPSLLQDLHNAHFSTTVAQVAATMEKPEYNGRLQKAMDLVLSNSVSLHEDGTATVKSGNRTYDISPECTCEDSQRRSKFCKHFLSVELLKKTYSRLHPSSNGHTPAAPVSSTQPASKTSQAATWAVNEAPASCCLKFQVNGLEILYTMRDTDDDHLFARIRRILPKIQEKIEQKPDQPTQHDEHHCPIHHVPMKRYTKGDQVWWSHKTADGSWCRGSK
jgi:hypothetical protein